MNGGANGKRGRNRTFFNGNRVLETCYTTRGMELTPVNYALKTGFIMWFVAQLKIITKSFPCGKKPSQDRMR